MNSHDEASNGEYHQCCIVREITIPADTQVPLFFWFLGPDLTVVMSHDNIVRHACYPTPLGQIKNSTAKPDSLQNFMVVAYASDALICII